MSEPSLTSRLRGGLSPASRSRGSVSLTSRLRGSLLGGALGDALGAPIEFMKGPAIRARFGERGLQHFAPAYGHPPIAGAITDDTQMTLFTAEGLIRAELRGAATGGCHLPSVVHHAYRRWLLTQGERWSEEATGSGAPWEPDGWLIGERFLHARRAPGGTCLAALRVPGPYGRQAANDSKGCGGVMRVAPVGFLYRAGEGVAVFRLGVEIAALTHGHRTGQLPAGVLAAAIHALVHEGCGLAAALDAATKILREAPDHDETLRPLAAARELAAQGAPSAERLETLGGGWIAEEALAIAVYAALSYPDDLRAALVLAANHSGDSDSTAAICGNLLGAALGESALPADWLAELEGRAVITQLADDFALLLERAAPESGTGSEPGAGAPRMPRIPRIPRIPAPEAWRERYPGT
ncbi:MAG: ADP-ribosylglycohydrolase family protein [Acidobacteriota bacterium]|nr:ADP-ribosylglycohydrolase family protein [Acidobacteriota bacterium]